MMLIRLLVVVLTLVGPMPFRVCTCAAGHTIPHTPAPVGPATVKKCCCTHHTPSADTGSTARVADAERNGQDHPFQHERDCPAANPGAVVREAIPQAATDAPPAGDTAHTVVWTALLPGVGFAPAPGFPRVPKNPLYLTLLTLRN